jgi:hypothetical protein
VDQKGNIVQRFASKTKPSDKEFVKAIADLQK